MAGAPRHKLKWQYPAVFIPAFLVGAYFDLTAYRISSFAPLAESALFLMGARILSGLIFALLVLALLRSGRDLWSLGRVKWRQMLLIALVLNAVTAICVATTRTVFYWDNAGYWMVARNLSEQWLGRSLIFEVLRSTVSMDYNYLLAFPISLVMRLFGGNRAVFLFAVSNLYTLPALWGLCALGRDRKWGGVLLAGFFPMLAYTGLVGFVDVAACALAIWAVVIYTSDRPAVSRGVFTGALLVGTFLLRRYFFFFAASFGVAALAVKLLFDRRGWRDFLALLCSGALCAVYLTPNFLLEKVLGSDYRDLYSAYAQGLGSDVKMILRYFGLLFLLALLAWAVRCLLRGKGRREIVFALVQITSCFIAFVSVQSHGQQHLLLYLPSLALLAVQMLPGEQETVSAVRRWGTAAASAVLFFWCLVPKTQPASSDAIHWDNWLPSFIFYGSSRTDIDELIALADYVDALSAEETKSAVVLSSSFTFNSETLTNLRASINLPQPAVQTLIRYQGTVDKRDALSWDTLTADYLIVGDPVQTHLGEENQQIMVLLARDVLEGTGPGRAYTPLPETFSLEDGVTVRIFRRTRELTEEEYHLVYDRLAALYPDYAWQYAPPQ